MAIFNSYVKLPEGNLYNNKATMTGNGSYIRIRLINTIIIPPNENSIFHQSLVIEGGNGRLISGL